MRLRRLTQREYSSTEEFIFSLPHLHRVEFTRIGRRGGHDMKFELKYYDNHISRSPAYTYTGYSPDELVRKLRKKLRNPKCHLKCCCHEEKRL